MQDRDAPRVVVRRAASSCARRRGCRPCSDSKPMNTPVQPASAISRTSDGSSVTSMRDGGAPDHAERPQRAAELAQVVGPRAEIVVDEDGVGLAVGRELGDDLLDVAHPIGHVQASVDEIAEAAAIVAAARRDQARRGEEAVARQKVAARRRVVAIGTPVVAAVDRLAACPPRRRGGSAARAARRRRSRARRRAAAASSGHDSTCRPPRTTFAPALAVPARELVRALREREMHGDADDLRERVERRRALEQVLVPVARPPSPAAWRRRCW